MRSATPLAAGCACDSRTRAKFVIGPRASVKAVDPVAAEGLTGSVGGECLEQLAKLVFDLLRVGRQLAFDGWGIRSRGFEESAIRFGLVARDQVAPTRLPVLRIAELQVGALMSPLRVHAAAFILPDRGSDAGSRAVGRGRSRVLQNHGSRIEAQSDEKARRYQVTRLHFAKKINVGTGACGDNTSFGRWLVSGA